MQAQTSYVECQVAIAASPETVFSFFTDPVKMVKWQGIAPLVHCDVEGRSDGSTCLAWREGLGRRPQRRLRAESPGNTSNHPCESLALRQGVRGVGR